MNIGQWLRGLGLQAYEHSTTTLGYDIFPGAEGFVFYRLSADLTSRFLAARTLC